MLRARKDGEYMAERVVDLDVDWRMDAGAPAPVLWQTEQSAILIFRKAQSESRVLVEFGGCLIALFGYPNDEALPGHALYERGLGHYRAYEVLDSSWLERLDRQNRIAFPKGALGRFRHFVITLHDSTFECLARTIEAKDFDGPLAVALQPYLKVQEQALS
jgi:hypothetical protein